MKLVILLLLVGLVLAGCSKSYGERTEEGWPANSMSVWHDDDQGVTCWVLAGGFGAALSCWPDHLLMEE
ncbi:hypothetical protein LCGC14_2338280 [marine sediment metagenome]|uniref:Lipoprotein n=1 Tax=marine sediment metagenome TaxID=412755 RepID=A0A0F9CDL0_9ZZZZ